MAIEEVIKDEYSDENFMVGDESETRYNSEPKLGDAFKVMDPEDYKVRENRNERLAVKAVDLAKENEILKADIGKYKIDLEGKALPSPDKKLIDIDTSSLSSFTTSVGESFMNLAKEVPNKIEEISKDPKKKRNFMRGLEIIEASSGIKPIGQATSTVGAISKGLLKAEKGFIAKDLAEAKNANDRLKALKSGRNVLDPQEKALLDSYTKYSDVEAANKKNYAATFDIYNLLKKAAIDQKELPTGALNKIFQGTEQIISEIPGGEELLKKLYDNKGDQSSMDPKERITFKNMLGAATKQKIVAQVKELYPVSNKDIEILLQTVGDVGTNPEALRRLVAAQMASRDIALNQRKYATKAFENNDLDFKENSFYESEKELANSFRKGVKEETLIEMFGTTEDITDSGIIAAHYYQSLQPQFKDGKNPFDIYSENKKKTEIDIQTIIENRQKGKEDLPEIPLEN